MAMRIMARRFIVQLESNSLRSSSLCMMHQSRLPSDKGILSEEEKAAENNYIRKREEELQIQKSQIFDITRQIPQDDTRIPSTKGHADERNPPQVTPSTSTKGEPKPSPSVGTLGLSFSIAAGLVLGHLLDSSLSKVQVSIALQLYMAYRVARYVYNYWLRRRYPQKKENSKEH
ncbi:hypothetical protein R1flu_015838 [Riccia fluitans]|uniref:ATP synthase protein MI25 n=1 Tax=Riccia fluitans TaxID=41844 RepID=A0ABD1YN62_9MARC